MSKKIFPFSFLYNHFILKNSQSQRKTVHIMSRKMKFRPSKLVPAPRQAFFLENRQENVEELEAPIKSTSDKKLYKVIKLQNGLRALLISDPTASAIERSQSVSSASSASVSSEEGSGEEDSSYSEDSDQPEGKKSEGDEEKQAACALCVGVGSYSDPAHIQGLAHFVEHMVFMGSEKYPKENDFDSFIKKKGGSDNAQTDCEVTSFHFEIPEKYLIQALDRFSQFFVNPLMKKEAMQREREAIESEFAMATPSNSNRKDQILSSLFPPGHPARTFTWGNLRSLKEMVSDDDQLYREAHRFRERHYSAHRMTVAIQARMNLETLEQFTVDTFGQIPTNNLPADNFTQFTHTPQLMTPEFKSMYLVRPVGDTTEVLLTWCMRPLIDEYESKPDQYISYLLGHEGHGSLLSYLKEKVWALGINTGNSASGIDYTSMYSLFSAQIMLTQSGLEQIDQVLEAVFSYINMMRKLGPSERIFKEIQTIEDVNFRFEEEQQPAEYVESLSECMQFYPPRHYITGDKIYYKYDPEGILELMNMMTVDSVNILLLSGKHSPPVQYDKHEEWFGTEYRKMDMPEEWLKRWTDVEPYEQFHLPDENPYITTDFDLIPIAPEYLDVAEKQGVDLLNTPNINLQKREIEELNVILRERENEANVKNFRLDQPNLLRKNKLMEVWYKPDFKFRMPTALLYFYFITPLSLKSAKDACLLDLWTDVLQQGLREPLYPADMASLSHEIYTGDKGLTIKINGYNQKLHLVVDVIAREMRDSCDKLTDSLFEAVRDVRRRSYHNILIKPAKLSKDVRMQLLLSPYVSLRHKAEEIDTITADDLREFHKRLIKHFYMQVLVQGNMPWHEALRIAHKLQSDLQFEPLPDLRPEIMVHELPLGVRNCRVSSFNLENTNSIITNYYQSGARNDKDLATLEVLMMLMEEPVFDRLRTKEQLGYSVFNLMRYTFGVLGYSLTVNTQADKYTARYVDGRIEAFLKKFSRDVARLPDKAFQAGKQAVIQLKHTADVELREEVERNWREIVSGEYLFSRLRTEVSAIESLRLSDMKAWFVRHTLAGDKSNLRKLSVQVVGHKENVTTNGTTNVTPSSYELAYLGPETGNGDNKETDSSFIYDVEAFKRSLPKYPLTVVKLEDC